MLKRWLMCRKGRLSPSRIEYLVRKEKKIVEGVNEVVDDGGN